MLPDITGQPYHTSAYPERAPDYPEDEIKCKCNGSHGDCSECSKQCNEEGY